MTQKFAWPHPGALVAVVACVLAAATVGVSAQLSAVDREAIEAAFARGDINGDGKLSRDESQRFPEIALRFDELDRNGDSFLSLAEFAVGATPPVRQ